MGKTNGNYGYQQGQLNTPVNAGLPCASCPNVRGPTESSVHHKDKPGGAHLIINSAVYWDLPACPLEPRVSGVCGLFREKTSCSVDFVPKAAQRELILLQKACFQTSYRVTAVMDRSGFLVTNPLIKKVPLLAADW